eukprot:COSAG05_NODE_922_length_6585_cov_180.946038_1_plen_88_part_10
MRRAACVAAGVIGKGLLRPHNTSIGTRDVIVEPLVRELVRLGTRDVILEPFAKTSLQQLGEDHSELTTRVMDLLIDEVLAEASTLVAS